MPVRLFQSATRKLHILCIVLPFTWPGAIVSAHAQDNFQLDPEDADAYSAIADELEGLRLDLNRATAEELGALPWISEGVARRIETFRAQRGPFRSKEDLLRVSGISRETLDTVSPYLFISMSHRISGRTSWRFTRPSSAPAGWGQLRIAQRTQIDISGAASGFFLSDRDPGETGLADFWSGYLVTSGVPGVNRVLVGDYRPGFGQGLIFSRYAWGAAGMAWAKPAQTRRVASRSSAECGALRGVFSDGSAGHLYWSVMYSSTAWDAAVNSEGHASIRSSGLHVTQTERARRGALKERLTGGRLAWQGATGWFGITALRARFNPPLSGPASGLADHRLAGVDWSLRLSRLAVFGEATSAGSRDIAWVAGSNLRLGALRLVALARRYAPGFVTLRGAAFSAYSGAPKNEYGLFLGATWRLRRGTQCEFSYDHHGRLAPTATLPVPGHGRRATLNLSQRLGRGTTFRLTLDAKRETVRTGGEIGPRIQKKVKTRLTWGPGAVRIKGWAEGVWSRSPSQPGTGRALGGEARVGRGPGPSLSVWASLFGISAYDARIYTFEPDVWGGSRLLMLTGRGQSGGLRLGWEGRRANLTARYSLKRTQTGASSSWAVQVELGTAR